MLHLGPIWYHSEPSDVPYSQNLLRPISWFGLFLQQNDSSNISIYTSKIDTVAVCYKIGIVRYIIIVNKNKVPIITTPLLHT